MQQEYEQFMATKPSLEEFELQLKRFMDIEQVGWTGQCYAASTQGFYLSCNSCAKQCTAVQTWDASMHALCLCRASI